MLTSKSVNKFYFVILVLTLSLGLVGAQSSELNVDDEVWLNQVDEEHVEIEYVCEDQENSEIVIEETGKELLTQEGNQTTIKNNRFSLDDFQPSTVSVKLYCNSEEPVEETQTSLKLLEHEVLEEPKGFVDGLTDTQQFNQPLYIDIKVNDEEGTESILADENLNFESKTQGINVDSFVAEEGKIILEIEERIGKNNFELIIEETNENTQRQFKIPINIYDFTYSFSESPGRQVDFRNLNDLQYQFTLSGEGQNSLFSENFVLEIYNIDEEEYEYTDKEWWSTNEPSSNPSEYQLELNNIPDLEPGRYQFRTYIENEDERTPLSYVRVEKSLTFSGIVRDSRGRTVLTEMELRGNGGTLPVSTDSGGSYSRDIAQNMFENIDLKFFDREQSSSDAQFLIEGVELEEESLMGGSEDAIGFEYTENPDASIEGITPVNMMAIKFGHRIQYGAKASMDFNPENIDPEELKVFECSNWNFQGRNCMSEFKQVPDEDVSVNYANWNVNIADLEKHTVPASTAGTEQNILMNAYIVGTNSQLGLRGGDSPLRVSGDTVKSQGEFEATGTAVSESGDRIEDVFVYGQLLKEGEVAKEYNTTSDSSGDFSLNGQAPEEPGDYHLRIGLERTPFKPFEQTSDSTIEVYYEKGMELSAAGDLNIEMGGTSTLDFDLSNTGQVPIADIDIQVENFDQQYVDNIIYTDYLEPGSTESVQVVLSIPEDYCPYPCERPPSFDLTADGLHDGEVYDAQASVYSDVVFEEEEMENQTDNVETNTSDEEDSTRFEGFNLTGDFLENPSSLNVTLALISVFLITLAIAVKKKKGNNDDRRNFNRAAGFQDRKNNMVSSSGFDSNTSKGASFSKSNFGENEEKTSLEKDTENGFDQERSDFSDTTSQMNEDSSGESNSNSGDSQNSEGKFVCSETGETFDTKAGLNAYKRINGYE